MARRSNNRTIGCLAVALLMVLTGGVLTLGWLRQQQHLAPLQFEQRCEATVGTRSVVLTRDQAYYTAIIAGTAVRRGLGEQGATVAIATVYQETGIRNLDYGDRDSVGLFQQRPSQSWGTPQQIMDPWYATNRFFDALEQVDGWRTADVNDTAQAVQRSGHPEAYRQHEPKARVLARAFTGAEPGGLSCFDERTNPGDLPGFRTELRRTHGNVPSSVDDSRLTLTAADTEQAWALAAYAIANAGGQGITAVETDGQIWRPDQRTLPSWQAGGTVPAGTVAVTFRQAE